ncbi:MAG: hypothetical protein A2Z88_05725 [Omnitrophica WOR_2 bacterium GWA2_47_8]|nr:MAG: hypothetical protein A2Z88_05725 [Omnitrophica WOR_2 bacterium GWA2_47_8]
MSVKITFDFVNGQIVVEGAEGNLLKLAEQAKSIAPNLSEIRIITQQKQSKSEIPNSVQATDTRTVSLRDFAKSLNLNNTYERIAAIAYHAIKIQGRASFSVKEMSDWFGLCGFKKPSIMSVAFSDTKRKYGYIDSKARDQWNITTSGENIIIGLLESKK